MQTHTRPLLLAVLLLGLGTTASALDLTVEVLNARSDQGTVAGRLFNAEANWPREAGQGVREPASSKVVLVYRDLPAGPYAVAVYHDENGNGKLDSNVAGIPLERYGFSRDARGLMGAPSFADAAVDLQADTTITVKLR